ncbi:MAG: class I SAM-dependent methyltransferase [Anaerolineae bacterium]|nr:class I SAM-dependent methyltransferase [Anaerolineae bacterium]
MTTMIWTEIAAETWDLMGGDEPQWDHDFFRRVIEENPGPALDIGCGTGRLLVRYLTYGLDIDGLELSADMLAICRRKALAQGFQPMLYQQNMITMALPKKYRTIFIPCGSFALVLDYEEAKQTLRRFYDHLEPGGILVQSLFDAFGPDSDIKIGEWVHRWTNKLADGRTLEVHFYTDNIDRVEQVYRGKRHYKLFRNGEMVGEQILEDTFRWYSANEIRLILELTGFVDIDIRGNETDKPFSVEHWAMMVTARKPQ